MGQNIISIGYAYDSKMSYLDHLHQHDSRIESARLVGDATQHAGRRIAGTIDGSARRIESEVSRLTDAVQDASREISSELRAARETMEWGFMAMLNVVDDMRKTLNELLEIARHPSRTWAYEQFYMAQENFEKGWYQESLSRVKNAIEGYQSNTGFSEEWRFHQLLGDIYLECPERSLIDLGRAEKSFLLAARYAGPKNKNAAALALVAAAVAAYNQGRTAEGESYAEQACRTMPELAEGHFQLARIRLYKENYAKAWQALMEAIDLDPRYAARVPFDPEFRRHARGLGDDWKKYARQLKTRAEQTIAKASAILRNVQGSGSGEMQLQHSRALALMRSVDALSPARDRHSSMVKLVGTSVSAAEEGIRRATEVVRENSVYAYLVAEKVAQEATLMAERACNASREAELTLRKVGEVYRRLPPVSPGTFLSMLCGAALGLVTGAVVVVVFAIVLCSGILGIKDAGDWIVYLIFVICGILGGAWGFVMWQKDRVKNAAWDRANMPQTAPAQDRASSNTNQTDEDDWLDSLN